MANIPIQLTAALKKRDRAMNECMVD